MREEGKVDGDKAGAIITIFLHVPHSQLEITWVPSTRRRAASPRRSLNAGRLSFTNRAPFPFRSAP